MRSRRRWIAIVSGAAVVLAAAAAIGPVVAGGAGNDTLPSACRRQPGKNVQIATAKLIIEFNSTDDDIGVHGAFDDHGWSELCVTDPSGRPIAVFDPQGQLDALTMAGVFFESREPPGDEFSMEDLATAFPEGSYRVRGRSFDGKELVGTAKFTHDVPAPPVITAPHLASDPEAPGAPVSSDDLVIAWDQVTETVDGGPVNISGYEVIVTKENHNDPNGFSKPTYDVHVGPGATSLSVPAEFFESDTVYEVEVLALEVSGNQTITVGFFVTD